MTNQYLIFHRKSRMMLCIGALEAKECGTLLPSFVNANRTPKRLFVFLLVLLGVSLALPGLSEDESGTSSNATVSKKCEKNTQNESEIKATYLFKFTSFVEWPEENLSKTAPVFKIGILGSDPFNEVLDTYLKNKTIKKRSCLLERSQQAEDLLDCQLVYIASPDMADLKEILSKFSTAGVLTVGESEAFTQQGGVIHFFREEKRIRFAINLDAARKAHLKVSSQLLLIAKIIGESEEADK